MIKFLFGRKGSATQENQRAIATRALNELNAVLSAMPERPAVTVDLSTGRIDVALPDQMPDEAPALPAPEKAEATAKDVESDAPEAEVKAAA